MDRSKWDYKKLGDISVFLTGCRPKGGVAQIKEGVHSLGGEHIGKDGYVDLSSPKFVPESFFINNKGHIKDNDILLCKDGALSGKVAIVRGELNDTKAMVNEHVFIIRSDSLLHKYLFYYLFSPTGQYQLKLRISGAAQGGINGANLSTIIVPYPKDVSLQQRIVAELDCLNEMIALKQEQLKEFDKLAQSIFYDMFGDPISNEKGWDKNKLDELYKVTSSKRILQSEWQDNGVPFYKVADIVNLIDGKTVIPSTFIKESTYNELISLGLVPNSGDILITSRGTLGECYIVLEGDKFYFQDGMITWLSQKANNILPIYLKSVFGTKSFLDSLLHNANMSTVAYLSIGQLSKVQIPLPPLALQQQFAEKIQAIEAQKELVKQSIAETQQLLDSRMDYYFD